MPTTVPHYGAPLRCPLRCQSVGGTLLAALRRYGAGAMVPVGGWNATGATVPAALRCGATVPVGGWNETAPSDSGEFILTAGESDA